MTMPNSLVLYRTLMREDLMCFTKLVFWTLYSERPFEQNWHHEVIADKLTRVAGGAIVLVQQRLHLEDLSGSLFGASEQWDHLALRSIAEGNEEWSIYGVVAWVRGRGGILHSEMESYDRLEQVREQIGGPVFEAQYQ